MSKYQKKYTGLLVAIVALAVFGYSSMQTMSNMSMRTMSKMAASSSIISPTTSAIIVEPEPGPIKVTEPAADDPVINEPVATTDPIIKEPITDDSKVTATDPRIDEESSIDNEKDDETTSTSDWLGTTIYNPETSDTTTTTTTDKTLEPKEEEFVVLNDPVHIAKTNDYIKSFIPRTEVVEIFKKQETQLTEEEKTKRETIKQQAVKDIDGDGIPDHEEYRIGTNIFAADSDNDGFKDGDEIKSGFNPLMKSKGNQNDKIQYKDPETVTEQSPVYKVERAEFDPAEQKGKDDLLQLSGKALPGSLVTVYIYSDPIVVTVLADADGNWSYVLHKELEEGEHKVYAAVTDSTGNVTERSGGFTFVKTARALTQAENETTQAPQQAVSPVQKAQDNITKIWLGIAVASILLALLSIGYFVKHRKAKENKDEKGEASGQGENPSGNEMKNFEQTSNPEEDQKKNTNSMLDFGKKEDKLGPFGKSQNPKDEKSRTKGPNPLPEFMKNEDQREKKNII